MIAGDNFMALISFINKNTYEIKDELEEYIYCDYEISYTIANLNKKGYKTDYSCAGHNEMGLLWPIHKLPISELDEYLKEAKNDKALHFISKDNEYFYHKDEKVKTYIYISFQEDYKFKEYPEGFDYELYNGNSYISKEIEYFTDNEHTKRKTDSEVYKELSEAQSALKEWVDKLEPLNK